MSPHNGVAVIAFPDVCKTPTYPAPVPIPYPSLGTTSQVKDVHKDPTSGKAVIVKKASFSTSTGDEAGTLKGMTSGTIKGTSEFMAYSFDVKLEGKNVTRLADPLSHNEKNVQGGNAAAKSVQVTQPNFARAGQLRSRLFAITSQLSSLHGGDPGLWHKLVDEYVLVTTELYLELTPK
jgi:hypothetical protein